MNVGQLFNSNQLGLVDINSPKSFQQLETDFGITIPEILRNSFNVLINLIKRRFRGQHSYPATNITTIHSLTSSKKKGCYEATRLYLRKERSEWEWGEHIRSFFTYRNDNLINITFNKFSVTKICNYFTLLRSSCRHRVLRPELMGAPKKPKSKHLSRPHRPFRTPLAAILDSLSSEQLPPAPLG